MSASFDRPGVVSSRGDLIVSRKWNPFVSDSSYINLWGLILIRRVFNG